MKFPFYKQPDQMDCGPTCVRMIAKYYGRNYSLQKLREICEINKHGVSLLGISFGAGKIGLQPRGVKIDVNTLSQMNLPCIIHWRQNHFVVLYKIARKSFINNERIWYLADPARGIVRYSEHEFLKNWISSKAQGDDAGLALLLTPSSDFFKNDGEPSKGLDLSYILRHLRKYKGLIGQLFAGLALGSLLQLIFPFLTQLTVDIGINTRNINFIYIVLIAQTMLFLGRIGVDFIRSWILLHISTRVNISILTDFLIKLMKLPMNFFDTKMTGDIMQRMSDQGRIQSFLTGSSLSTIFSLFNLFLFAFVLAYYSVTVFFVFLGSSILYLLLIKIFLNKRRDLDFKRFDISSENQSTIVELIAGMQEIKLNNCEQQKRWEWERVQANLFNFNIKSLALGQYQQLVAFFINEGKNIVITFIVAKSVIDGQLTLGGMMAIQYVVGQLNSPIEQLVGFLQSFQDAKLSLERLNEIQEIADEEPLDKHFLIRLPAQKTIKLKDLSFKYPGAGNEMVLSNINLEIPEGKTTAIVGMSGSGKTTLLKLLLRYYEPQFGEAQVGKTNLNQIGYRFWRGQCGIVMQDGFIFSDTIIRNIAVAEEYPDMVRVQKAIEIANIFDFIEELPMGLHTKIGAAGNGISQGQKQRILIARAVYKDPEYIFFDEATNALDANNEKIIMENLETFFKDRTVVVVAHRLSTVKKADNIIVLNKGVLVEQGTHLELTRLKGEYFHLVKNQLELG